MIVLAIINVGTLEAVYGVNGFTCDCVAGYTTFWEIAARSVNNLFSLYFVYLYIYLFPVLVLRAGFAFRLLQFLFIAFLLLLYRTILCY